MSTSKPLRSRNVLGAIREASICQGPASVQSTDKYKEYRGETPGLLEKKKKSVYQASQVVQYMAGTYTCNKSDLQQIKQPSISRSAIGKLGRQTELQEVEDTH